MSKTIAMIVVVVVLIVVTIYAPQITAAIMAALAVSHAIAAAILLVAVIAFSMAAQMLLAPKPPKINQSMQDRLNTSIVPAAPRKIVFGLTAAGADVRFQESVPSTNPDYIYQVVALASHKINSLQSIYIEDVLSWTPSGVTGQFASGLTVSYVAEGNTGNAAAFGSGSYWTSTSKFTGCAYVKLRYKADFQKIFPGGIPTRFTAIAEGCPVFDPRLSTAVGGSGSMDPTNQSTWAYYNGTDEIGRNPACVMATYLLGWHLNSVPCWGMNIPSSRIDWANFITYANICDEAVAVAGGGTVKRYQCDAIFDTSMTHESIINAITTAMGSTKLVDSAGLYSFVLGHDDTLGPILTFSQDDLLGPYEWTPAPSTTQRFNIASGRFASPPDLYQLIEWGQIALDPLPDNIQRTQTMDFAAVSRAQTCQRIAKQLLVRNQVQGQFTCTFGPRAFAANVGTLLYLSLPAEWNNKLFRVIEQTESAELIFNMILQEEDAIVYAWDSSEEIALPANIKVPGYDPTDVATPSSVTATARQIATTTGGYESAIDLTWTVPGATAARMQVQAKEHTGSVWMTVAEVDASIGAVSFKAPAGGLSTDIQCRFVMASGAFGPWDALTVTAAAGGSSNTITAVLASDAVTFPADSSGTIL